MSHQCYPLLGKSRLWSDLHVCPWVLHTSAELSFSDPAR